MQPIVSVIAGIARAMRAIIGVPDYDLYVSHVRKCHPDRVPISRDDFIRDRLDARYARPGSRCC
jgi:uncharacterized short protein YbdD (DUF466 family)